MPSFTHIWVHWAGVLSLAMCVTPHMESVTTPVSDCCCANTANPAANASMSTTLSFVFVFISASPLIWRLYRAAWRPTFPATKWSIFCRIVRLRTQSPVPQRALLHKRKEDGYENQHVDGRGDHA